MKIIDTYYRRPILYDYLMSFLIISILVLLNYFNKFELPCASKSIDFSSDVGAIGLTVSGFVLTLVTILLTFKSGQILSAEKLTNESSPFKIFLGSKMYHQAIKVLKEGVYSLVFISMLTFILKLGLGDSLIKYMFYVNLVGLIIILTTFLRCFFVLSLILKMQE